MKLVLTLAAGGFLALTGSAHAQTACTRPQPPAPVDGATATMDQLMAGKKAAADFLATSDQYQTCMVDGVKAQRDAAKAAHKKFDNAIAKDADAQLSANQKDKESVGAAFNNAVHAYRAAHPS